MENIVNVEEVQEKEEVIGNVVGFEVGIEGNKTFNIQCLKETNMLGMIEALAVTELTMLSQLINKDNPIDVIKESMKAFVITKNEIIIQSLENMGIENAHEIFEVKRG